MNVYRGEAPQWQRYFDPGLRLFLPVDKELDATVPARGYWKPSDTHWKYPLAYGYANVGRVVACGREVKGPSEGDLIYAYEPHQTYYVAPAESVIRLPHLANPALGVLFANMNTAYNGVLDSDIRLGDTVVIFGQGLIGLLLTQYVRRTAARQVFTVDPVAGRRTMSLRLGADEAIDPAGLDVARHVRELTEGRGADVVIDVTGSYVALQEAIRTAAPNTTVVALSWYGGPCDALRLADEFHHNRITIKCSQVGSIDPALSATHSVPRRTKQVLDAFEYLELAPLVTDYVPFAEAPRGYDIVDQHSEKTIQVVLDYEGTQ
jgi:threonine dehydrogenase-like Zn-dependent dehydrogenase